MSEEILESNQNQMKHNIWLLGDLIHTDFAEILYDLQSQPSQAGTTSKY